MPQEHRGKENKHVRKNGVTHALDLASAFQCLAKTAELAGEQHGTWIPRDATQENALSLFARWRNELPLLTDTIGTAHISWDPTHTIGSITVETVLDKLVRWLNGKADRTTIFTSHRNEGYPGFILKNGFEVRQTRQGTLVRVQTQSRDTLWFFLPTSHAPVYGIAMVQMASNLITEWETATVVRYDQAHVPMLDFELKPDIDFLQGLSIEGSKGHCSIAEATQDFRMRMDQEGAHAVVRTTTRSMVLGAARPPVRILVLDKPFYGWFMQGKLPIPLAVFNANYDSWRKPTGSLEAL